ncbi:MAG: ribosomal protein S18-alanine N-acetyltransferase [Candidatus Methanofastidiosia archaeon]
MAVDMLIRTVEPQDILEIVKIEYECFKYPYPPTLMNFLFANYKETFIIAEVDKIAGYVIGIIEGKEGHILSIAVKERYRHLGIGKSLMDKILEMFKEKGVKFIRLEVRESNVKAIVFYQRLGFVKKKKMDAYYEDGEAAFVMTKSLG